MHQGERVPVRNVANALSLGRVFLIAAAAVLYLGGWRVAGPAVAAVSGFTDLLDGWLARRLGLVTELGATLDRLGDLAFESTALAVLCGYGLVPSWVVVAYLLREFSMLSIRVYAAQRGVEIATSWFGKLKTDFLCLGCLGPFLLHTEVLAGDAAALAATWGLRAIYVGIGFSYLSAGQYVRRAWRTLAA